MLGNRVVATAMEWVTSSNAPDGHPTAPYRPVLFKRLHGVCRTTRVVAARGGKERSNPQLVDPHHAYQKGLHHPAPVRNSAIICFTTSKTCSRRASYVRVYADGRHRSTTSTPTPMGSSSSRTRLRSRRFRRLRATTVCLWSGTTSPTRGKESGEATQCASRSDVRSRFPSRATLSNSAR